MATGWVNNAEWIMYYTDISFKSIKNVTTHFHVNAVCNMQSILYSLHLPAEADRQVLLNDKVTISKKILTCEFTVATGIVVNFQGESLPSSTRSSHKLVNEETVKLAPVQNPIYYRLVNPPAVLFSSFSGSALKPLCYSWTGDASVTDYKTIYELLLRTNLNLISLL